ncbi:MAG: glycosyltransferase [Thermoanaerobaculia bacterium]
MRDAVEEPVAAPRVRRPIAVVLSRFPLITETFILREITELERQGQPVILVPMIREDPDVVHDEARPWIDRALFTPFISPAILASCARALLRSPGVMTRLLWWIVRHSIYKPGLFVRSLMLFPKSVHLAELLQDADVKHVHAHFATHPATMATIIEALAGIPFSFTVHAHDIFVSRVLLREKLRRAQFIRSISRFNRSYLAHIFPKETAGKVHVVHVGIRSGAYRPAESPADPAKILCIAALKPYKGVPHLVDACRILAAEGIPFACDIIGSGPMEASIRRSIERQGLAGRVRLRGALTQDEVAAELPRAAVFVLPSIVASNNQMEGIPVALMEAMAAGVPVVATAISGIPELVEEGVTGTLVDPGNPRSLADAIRRLLADRDVALALAERGRERVAREFELQRTVGELLVVLDSVSGDVKVPAELLIRRPLLSEAAAIGLRAVHYRTDSIVIEAITFGPGGSRDLVVKSQRAREGESRAPEPRARDEHRLLERLSAHFASVSDPPRTGVPEPLAFDPADATVVMSRARGVSLERLIRNARSGTRCSTRALERGAFGAGVWLRRFQQFERTTAGGVSLDRLLAQIHFLLDRHSEVWSETAASHIREHADDLHASLRRTARKAVAHHGDFWPGNVFSIDGDVDVIDFEGYRLGLASEDIGYFQLHSGLYFEPARHRDIRALLDRAFVDGYGGGIDSDELALCRIACALAMLHERPHDFCAVQTILRRRYLRRELFR